MPGDKLDEMTMAIRAAKEFEDGMVVNLGVGIPSACSNFVLPDREVIFHSENGVLGFGPVVTDVEKADPWLINANAQPVQRLPGMAIVTHEESFAMIRGGRIDISVLGSLQVAENGDLANYHLPGKPIGSFGGGQDLAFCAKKLLVVMTHQTKDGKPKVMKEVTLPLTAPRVVKRIITDVAVIDVTEQGMLLREHVPGWSLEDIQAITEARLQPADDFQEMTLY